MTVKDYSGVDFDFAVGEVYGLRMWRMDAFGRLRARNIDTARPWKPGVNEATCLSTAPPSDPAAVIDPSGKDRTAKELSYSNYMSGGIVLRTTAGANTSWPTLQYEQPYTVTWEDGEVERYDRLKFREVSHPSPDEKCTCGFYAYSDPQHEEVAQYDGQHLVLGIIRGTGRTLIGTKGFRCEKAEIVALRDPSRCGDKKTEWRVRQTANLRRVYPDAPLLASRAELLAFAPVQSQLPEPTSDDFWSLP